MELREQLSIRLFCAILLAAIPFSENFEVISSPTVTGIVGQDVVLPCQISTRTQPDNMEVLWKKIIQVVIETVYEYKAQTGQDVQGQKYQGRTVLLKDGFTSGNVSLKLKNVQPADEGTYSCIVKANQWSADATTELKIAAVAPVSIDVLGPQGQGIDLACRSTGWFPKPELNWVTKNRKDLQPVTETEQDRELLFSVLSHVTILGEETGEISCVIQNSLLKTEQKSVILLSGGIFPRGSPWLAAFWVLFTLDLLVIGACALWGYKEKKKDSKKKASEEECLLNKETERMALESDCQEFRERLDRAVTELEFRRARSYMVPITLDTSYKYPELTVSADGRTVWHNPSSQGAAAPSRALIAVGSKGFVASRDDGGVRRWYWEVEVGDNQDWELGVLSESVWNRVKQERLERPPEGGCWALKRSEGQYHPKDARTVMQNWGVRLTVVGVYLDLEGGSLSFYSVNSMAFILEIPVKGSERFFPFLIPGYTVGRDQRKPLSICPPSDWDFPQKLMVSLSSNQGEHTECPTSNNEKGAGKNTGPATTGETAPAPAQPPVPNNGKGAGKNAGPVTTGETAPAPAQYSAANNGKGAGKNTGPATTGETAPAPAQPPAPNNGKGAEKNTGPVTTGETAPPPAQSSAPNNGKGAGKNTGPATTGETAPAPAQPPAPNNGKGAGKNTGPATTGETAPAPAQPPAPNNGKGAGKNTGPATTGETAPATAQPSAPNNGKGAGKNTGPATTGETAPATAQPSAPADQDVKRNSTRFSGIKNFLKWRKGDETEQEHLQAEGGKEMPDPNV